MKLGRITMALRTSTPVAVADALPAWRLWDDSAVPRKVKVNYREDSPTVEWYMQHGNPRGVHATFAHLPRLWTYELECWTIVDGREVRLDTEELAEGMGA